MCVWERVLSAWVLWSVLGAAPVFGHALSSPYLQWLLEPAEHEWPGVHRRAVSKRRACVQFKGPPLASFCHCHMRLQAQGWESFQLSKETRNLILLAKLLTYKCRPLTRITNKHCLCPSGSWAESWHPHALLWGITLFPPQSPVGAVLQWQHLELRDKAGYGIFKRLKQPFSNALTQLGLVPLLILFFFFPCSLLFIFFPIFLLWQNHM